MNNFTKHNLVISLIFMLLSCNNYTEDIPVIFEISSDWEFSEGGMEKWLPAIVPGTVHSDLLANGIINDPHYSLNENDVQWVEKKDWIYRVDFKIGDDILAKENIEIIFKGLDTYSDVYLNDSLILSSDNMFIEHRIGVKGILAEGINNIKVIFHSPVNEGLKKLRAIDYLIPAINEQAPVNERTNVFTRKAPFHFGWDWGPRLVTSGVWRPVFVKAWDNAVIEDVYLETRKANEINAEIFARIEVIASKAGSYKVNLNINEMSRVAGKLVDLKEGVNFIELSAEIRNPKLWWTNGLGKPYLYTLSFSLEKGNLISDKHEIKYGVRTLRLVQEPDSTGRSFYFELNGFPVFMKGANVIPSETLTPMVTKETYQNLINNAVEAHMNMVRVWGGAIYEDDYFYQLCDQNGILVWQDFMFACALQPGDEAHLENIRKEAVYNVKRLRNNASLALWCGNNENLHGWHHWGWKEMFSPATREYMWKTYERIFYEILPAAVHEFDPKTQYWSSSPISYDNKLADRKSGDEHDWTIWFGQKSFSAFEENIPRFVSEYGIQSFPGMQTINGFSPVENQYFESPVMRHRQRSKMEYIKPGFDGNDMIKWYMGNYYKVPDNFEEFVYVSQLLQAKAYKTAIESHRRAMPHCMGSLYWQLNDSWPTISWSSVDYYGRWKASHYAVRKAYNDVIVSASMHENELKIFVVSDRLTPIESKIKIRLMNFDGIELFNKELSPKIPANSSIVVFSESIGNLTTDNNTKELVVVIDLLEDDKVIADNLYYFHEPKDLIFPDTEIKFSATKTAKGYLISISSDKMAGSVFLDIPSEDVFLTDNFFDILPGQQKFVELITDQIIDVNEIKVLSLNKLQGY